MPEDGTAAYVATRNLDEGNPMNLADYPFLDVLWSMFLFFLFFAWIWIAVVALMDNFHRTDHGGLAKAVWTVFIIFLPILGVLSYMISRPAAVVTR